MTLRNPENKPEYLGDGLYARIENGQIELLANSPTEPTDVVYLELPYVWHALVSFVARKVNKVGS